MASNFRASSFEERCTYLHISANVSKTSLLFCKLLYVEPSLKYTVFSFSSQLKSQNFVFLRFFKLKCKSELLQAKRRTNLWYSS